MPPVASESLDRPSNVSEYHIWVNSKGTPITESVKKEYNSSVAAMLQQFQKSQFWQELTKTRLREFNQSYQGSHNQYHLLLTEAAPDLLGKSFDSVVIKSLRVNVLGNRNWPDPPEGGWRQPDNWLELFNDVIRTRFIVKYFDGVQFLMDKLAEFANTSGLNVTKGFRAYDDGYYAAHVYVSCKFNIPAPLNTRQVTTQVEMQITTQVQEVITQLLHEQYEGDRLEPPQEDDNWKWDNRCKRFSRAYLGHTLHHLEGVILDVRDRTKGTDK